MNKRNERIFTCINSVIFIAIATPLFIIAINTKYPPAVTDTFKPMHLPAYLLGFLIVLSGGLLLTNLFMLKKEAKIQGENDAQERFVLITNKPLFTLIAVIIYGFTWNYLGFTLSTALFFAILAKKLEPDRSWKQVILVSVIFTILIYALFVLLFQIPFPDPFLNMIF